MSPGTRPLQRRPRPGASTVKRSLQLQSRRPEQPTGVTAAAGAQEDKDYTVSFTVLSPHLAFSLHTFTTSRQPALINTGPMTEAGGRREEGPSGGEVKVISAQGTTAQEARRERGERQPRQTGQTTARTLRSTGKEAGPMAQRHRLMRVPSLLCPDQAQNL